MDKKERAVHVGMSVFLTAAAILLFYDTLFGKQVLVRFGRQFKDALKPIFIGAMLAYLLAPILDFVERRLFSKQLSRAHAAGQLIHGGARVFSVLTALLFVCALLYILGSILMPQLYASIRQLVSNVEIYYRTVAGWVQRIFEDNPTLEEAVEEQIARYYGDILRFLQSGDVIALLQEKIMPQAQTLMSALSGGVVSFALFLKDLLVGIIVSVYFMTTKERTVAHIQKLSYSLFSGKKADLVLAGVRKANLIFSGFVRGKLLDSLIIGVLCFIGCTILRFPYTPLVSVIVGVTNIIPFFGPFLGAVPSAFLILLVSPAKALYFVIFVLALQQLDGNVIGPRILGDQTGLPSLWVIIAILVGGKFFGLPGMFFGVPVCAWLYNLATFWMANKLRGRGMPVETEAYSPLLQRRKAPEEEEKK